VYSDFEFVSDFEFRISIFGDFMGQILGLKFRDQGQIYYFLAAPFVVGEGDMVLVKTEEGLGLGKVVLVREDVPEGFDPEQLKSIYRIATPEDVLSDQENKELAGKAFSHCRECIRKRELEMKLVDVEVYFDRSKMIFYFTAPGRIDFRELVKDLVRAYRTRIELRQIGVRHETQMLGGLGNCGQVCCCRRYLRKFEPVTIKMAKDQNLFLNPTKISGVCGRLLCCLSFEEQNYSEFKKRCPKIGKSFSTSLGRGRVLRANIFRDSLIVQFESGEEREVSMEEWASIRVREGEEPEQPSLSVPVRTERQTRPEQPARTDRQDRQEPVRTEPPARVETAPAQAKPAPDKESAATEQPEQKGTTQAAGGEKKPRGKSKRGRSRGRGRRKPRQKNEE
jgi:cell fate regulator YaaT (PSP1 superfamily)